MQGTASKIEERDYTAESNDQSKRGLTVGPLPAGSQLGEPLHLVPHHLQQEVHFVWLGAQEP